MNKVDKPYDENVRKTLNRFLIEHGFLIEGITIAILK